MTAPDANTDLLDASYRLEVVGEALIVEAKELRHRAAKLAKAAPRRAKVQALIEKLHSVERQVRHQVESVREVEKHLDSQ